MATARMSYKIRFRSKLEIGRECLAPLLAWEVGFGEVGEPVAGDDATVDVCPDVATRIRDAKLPGSMPAPIRGTRVARSRKVSP
jgi:hypothetical protein